MPTFIFYKNGERVILETFSVVLTFKSVDEILWCDHSNKTSSTVLLHGTICFSIFKQSEILDLKWTFILGTIASLRIKLRCPVLYELIVVNQEQSWWLWLRYWRVDRRKFWKVPLRAITDLFYGCGRHYFLPPRVTNTCWKIVPVINTLKVIRTIISVVIFE